MCSWPAPRGSPPVTARRGHLPYTFLNKCALKVGATSSRSGTNLQVHIIPERSAYGAGGSGGDFDQGAAGHRAVEVALEARRQLVEADGARADHVEVPGLQVGREPLPDVEPQVARRVDGVDAEQADGAQDERHDGCVQLGALREPHDREVAAVAT